MVSHSFCLLLTNGMQTKSLAAAFLEEKTAWRWRESKMTNKNNNKQAESCSSKVNHHGSIKEMQ